MLLAHGWWFSTFRYGDQISIKLESKLFDMESYVIMVWCKSMQVNTHVNIWVRNVWSTVLNITRPQTLLILQPRPSCRFGKKLLQPSCLLNLLLLVFTITIIEKQESPPWDSNEIHDGSTYRLSWFRFLFDMYSSVRISCFLQKYGGHRLTYCSKALKQHHNRNKQ